MSLTAQQSHYAGRSVNLDTYAAAQHSLEGLISPSTIRILLSRSSQGREVSESRLIDCRKILSRFGDTTIPSRRPDDTTRHLQNDLLAGRSIGDINLPNNLASKTIQHSYSGGDVPLLHP